MNKPGENLVRGWGVGGDNCRSPLIDSITHRHEISKAYNTAWY